MPSRLLKKSFSLSGHRTSVALEPAFWAVLASMAEARAITLATLIQQIDAARDPDDPLASRLRVDALAFALTSRQSLPGDPALR